MLPMVSKIFTKVFGSRNERLIKKMLKEVAQITQLEDQLQALDDRQLQQKTE